MERGTPLADPSYANAPRSLPATDATFRVFLGMAIVAVVDLVVLSLDAVQSNGLLTVNYTHTVAWLGRIGPLTLITLSGFGLCLWLQVPRLAPHVAQRSEHFARHWRWAGLLLLGLGFLAALGAVWVLRAFPNSGDEAAYLFEARTFLAGRLWNPVPPFHELFARSHILFLDGKWFAGYPPGWPLLLAAVMGLDLRAWLAGPLSAAVLLYAMMQLGRRRGGALGGVLAVAVTAVTPFFIFNAASYFDMVSAAALGLLFAWAGIDFLDEPRLANAVCAGLALGGLGLIRSQAVLLFGLPFAAQFLLRARRRHYLLAPTIILVGLPFLAGLLYYNYRTRGSFIPYGNLVFPAVRFGLFPVTELGKQLTPFDELHFVAARLIMLAEWTSPFLVLGYFAGFAVLAVRRRLCFLDFIFPLYVFGFMLVPFDGGNQYGPRYYFEGFPFLVLTVVSAVTPLLQAGRKPRQAAFFSSLLVAHALMAGAATMIFAEYAREVVDQRMDVYDQVRDDHLHNAVVVLGSPTGALLPLSIRDLTRNGINLDRNVLYVRNIPSKLPGLERLFPRRRFYRYERAPKSLRGSLQPLGPSHLTEQRE